MKKLTTLFVTILISGQLTAAEVRIGIGDVAKKISQSNLLLLENAERTYQASEAVGVARANLLPQLNLWDWVGFTFTLTDILGRVTDIAPFLVPGNWFRVAEQKILVNVERNAYHALWANQILAGKLLYYRVLHDEALLKEIDDNEEMLKNIHAVVRTREILGGLPPGTSKTVEARILAMQEDRRALKALIRDEKGRLTYAMALPVGSDLKLTSLLLPDIRNNHPLKYATYEPRVLSISPEIQQFGHLVRVIPYIKKELRWSFLGTSSLSRGVAGGIFDDIPIQRGLGFGRGATMAIIRSKENQIKLQQKGVTETIKHQLRLLIESYNLDLENFHTISRRKEIAQELFKELNERILMGAEVDFQELTEVSRTLISAQTSMAGLSHRYFAHVDRLNRMMLTADYGNRPQLERLFPAEKAEDDD